MTDETQPQAPSLPATSGPVTMQSSLALAAQRAEQLGVKLSHPFPSLPSQAAPTRGDIAGNRALWLADEMVRNGADIERVKAAVTAEGANPDLIDDRTPAQRAHDDAYGMPHRVDPQSYYFSLPSAAEIGDPAAFSNDLRGVVARLEPAVATAPPLAINPAPRGRRLIETG